MVIDYTFIICREMGEPICAACFKGGRS